MPSPDLDALVQLARSVTMTPQQQEEQRRSFVFGNTKLENERITRELVDTVAKALAGK